MNSPSQKFFTLEKTSRKSKARAGFIRTAHGDVRTPVFMPVGTSGSVRALVPRDLYDSDVQIILGNTYHLYLQPGCGLIENAGGLHRFINWERPMLTDSGGFQVWSMQDTIKKINREGVLFASHIDGSRIFFTPENVMESQRKIGADIIMAFDICPPYPCPVKELEKSADITMEWTHRALDWLEKNPAMHGYSQHFFGIIQGGYEREIRARMTAKLAELDLPGYAVGGLSVGEPMPKAYEMADFCTGLMPSDKPRYIMGIGTPKDLLTMVGSGGDMYDCVVPTRNARNGMVWTWQGVLHYKAARYAKDLDTPLDPDCTCYTCRSFSRAYLRHLFKANELTVLQLASLHNIHFFCDLMKTAREKILSDEFESWSKALMTRWEQDPPK